MPEAETRTFPLAHTLDLGFDPVEDRLLLVGHTEEHGRRVLWLTRRLVRGLVVHFSRLLRTSSEDAAMAPAGYGNEILRMEHVRALELPSGFSDPEDASKPNEESKPDKTDSAQSGPDGSAWRQLVTEVTLQQREDKFFLGFSGVPFPRDAPKAADEEAEPGVAFLLDRVGAHKILALLCKKIKELDWGEDVQPEWLNPPDFDLRTTASCQ